MLAETYPQQQHGCIYICIAVMARSVLNIPTPLLVAGEVVQPITCGALRKWPLSAGIHAMPLGQHILAPDKWLPGFHPIISGPQNQLQQLQLLGYPNLPPGWSSLFSCINHINGFCNSFPPYSPLKQHLKGYPPGTVHAPHIQVLCNA